MFKIKRKVEKEEQEYCYKITFVDGEIIYGMCGTSMTDDIEELSQILANMAYSNHGKEVYHLDMWNKGEEPEEVKAIFG